MRQSKFRSGGIVIIASVIGLVVIASVTLLVLSNNQASSISPVEGQSPCVVNIGAIIESHKRQVQTVEQDKAAEVVAIANFSRAIELAPNQAQSYYNRARAYYEQDQYGAAIADFDKAIELMPEWVAAYYGRAGAYYLSKDYDRAIADYTKIVQLEPSEIDAYHRRAGAYREKQQYKPAITDYTHVLELNPDYTEAYLNRGRTYALQGDYPASYQDFRVMADLNPGDARPYYWIANNYFSLRNYQEATNYYNLAIETDPKYPYGYTGRGDIYLLVKRDFGCAIVEYSKALELNATIGYAYYQRGEALKRFGQPEVAQGDFLRATEFGYSSIAGAWSYDYPQLVNLLQFLAEQIKKLRY